VLRAAAPHLLRAPLTPTLSPREREDEERQRLISFLPLSLGKETVSESRNHWRGLAAQARPCARGIWTPVHQGEGIGASRRFEYPACSHRRNSIFRAV
jgi:hypothetical protein